MTIIALVGAEFRRLTATKLGRIAFVALMLVPVLYGGLYLWGNQNPYANLKNVPAGLVVSDTGTTVDGEQVNYGESVKKSLLTGKEFDWKVMTAAQASAALSTGGVDFVVTVPKSFSSDLASASSASPTRAQVQLATNDANSYLSSTIAGQAATAIRSSVAAQVGSGAASQFLVGLSSIRSSLTDAASGAKSLSDGATTAASGAATLTSGATTLASGLDTLQTSTAGLPSSSETLADGAQSAAAGSTTVKNGAASLSSGLAKIDAGSASTASALERQLAADGLSESQIQQAVGILTPGASAVHSAATSAATLSSGAATLASGTASVSAGATTLAASTPALADGIASADSGAHSVRAGATTLQSGVASLQSGATTLTRDLQAGVKEIPETTAAGRATQAAAIGDPVAVATDKVTDAGSYGAGLAPFFLTLAAWIGSYALFLILRPLSRRAITALRAPVRVTLAGWLTPAILGVVQAVALFFIATLALGFSVVHPIGMLGVLGLAAITFAAILLALNALLGSVGQFLGLILMIVQLVTAGGTFPWQTLPTPLAALHHALPMSYSVDALRQVMYGGNLSLAWSDSGVLAIWLVAALALTALTARRMTAHRTLRDLRPSLIGG